MDIRHKIKLDRLGRWGSVSLGGALLTALALWGFTSMAQGAENTASVHQGSAAIAVRTVAAEEGRIATSLSYSAEVKATSQVNVLPKGSGRIERLLVGVGSRVKKGDPIAELETDSLEAQVSQAKANLVAAKAKYAGMESGSRAEQIAQAKAGLDAAQARLDATRKGARETEVQAAESAVEQARANLASARAALERVKQGATQAELAAAQSAVDQAKAAISSAQANLDDVRAGAKDAEIWAAQNAVDAARAQLYAANDRVDTWKGTSSDAEKMATGATSTSQAVKGSEAAQSALDAAVARLNLLKSKPLPAELQAAESALATAKANYDAAAARLEQMKRGPTAQDIQQAEAVVQATEATLAGAEARLKQLQDGPTAEELRVAESAVVQARQQYSLAANPYTQNDLDQVKAMVDQAQAALEMAELALKESVVVSPIDGVVAEKLQSEGALVSPATPIVSVVAGEVELTLGVEESQIGQVQEGQKAEISVVAYPGEVFPAEVALIAPTADPKSRTFQVKVRPAEKGGKLRQGMFAQVKIVVQEKEKVVLVPKDAVVTRSGQTSVFVVRGEKAEMREVKLGLAQNGTIEVTEGLEAGEEVVVAGQNELRDGDVVARKS